MGPLTKTELEYINNFLQREGDYKIKKLDKERGLCVISVPVFDASEDIGDPHKIATFPISYGIDEDGVYVCQSPHMLKPGELLDIMEYVEEKLEIDFER